MSSLSNTMKEARSGGKAKEIFDEYLKVADKELPSIWKKLIAIPLRMAQNYGQSASIQSLITAPYTETDFWIDTVL